jgi:hypothetical protein
VGIEKGSIITVIQPKGVSENSNKSDKLNSKFFALSLKLLNRERQTDRQTDRGEARERGRKGLTTNLILFKPT